MLRVAQHDLRARTAIEFVRQYRQAAMRLSLPQQTPAERNASRPADFANSTSLTVSPPSGPIITKSSPVYRDTLSRNKLGPIDVSGHPCPETRLSLLMFRDKVSRNIVTDRCARLLFPRDQRKVELRDDSANSSNAMTPRSTGTFARPHCSAASVAIFFHRSIRAASFASFSRAKSVRTRPIPTPIFPVQCTSEQ